MTLGISDEEFENAIDEAARSRRIDLAHAHEFPVGPVRVVPSLRTVKGPDGEEVLEPKVMQVLIALNQGLAEAGGDILSRDDLIERCWEGRVVGESSINRVISLLRAALKSVSGETLKVENVPKVGYRLLLAPDWEPAPGPVEQTQGQSTAQASDAPERGKERAGSGVLAAGLAALLAILVAAYALWPSASPAPVERLKVAMLPLKTGDGVDPLYARGLEAELRSQLARIGQFEVTSSESARLLYEQGLSADEICRKLGADFTWVGALNVEPDRVTLTSSLIEASTNDRPYRESLSSSPSAAQTLPLRSARAIATALGRPVSERLPQRNVSAGDYRLYLTALGLIKGRGIEQREAALEIMQQVTANNPEFADGWAGLAKATYLYPSNNKAEVEANRAEAADIVEKALALDEDSVDALKVKAVIASTPSAQRIALIDRAVELDPGDSEAWFWRGIIYDQLVLEAGSPVEGAKRMVAIDPLWPASWRVSELIAKFGDLEGALDVEEAIASAAITPSQEYFSEARRAMLRGDFSAFIEFSQRAQPTATPAERRYGSQIQLRMIQHLLGLPVDELDFMPPEMNDPLIEAVQAGDLPSARELAAGDAGGADFWTKSKLASLALPLFISEGREVELVRYYDAAFPRRDDFLRFAATEDQAHNIIPSVSPYLVLAFRKLGREEDAAWQTERMREQVERWKAADTGSIYAVIYELMLAALEGDQAGAAAMVQRLPDFGWPYSMAHITPTTTTLLRDDPLYDPVRDLPEVRAVIDPIRANLAKEREEVLALGR
ncbi:MAG: winged helix-turn-helix domain-containing protein [Pseudomonadota bacterium]